MTVVSKFCGKCGHETERTNGGACKPCQRAYNFAYSTANKDKCACGCKQPLGTDYHLDHRMPLALGGEHADHNMQLLRATCNHQKYAKHPIDFMQQRGFLL